MTLEQQTDSGSRSGDTIFEIESWNPLPRVHNYSRVSGAGKVFGLCICLDILNFHFYSLFEYLSLPVYQITYTYHPYARARNRLSRVVVIVH